jgi:hypothetical protein
MKVQNPRPEDVALFGAPSKGAWSNGVWQRKNHDRQSLKNKREEMIVESPLQFEQGPIRPPNEAKSLLLRVTRNCPWNQCLFCPVYKGEKFSLRDVQEVKEDIRAARDMADEIKALSWRLGESGNVTNAVMTHILNNHHSYSYQNVAI